MYCICVGLAWSQANHGYEAGLQVLTTLNFLTTPSLFHDHAELWAPNFLLWFCQTSKRLPAASSAGPDLSSLLHLRLLVSTASITPSQRCDEAFSALWYYLKQLVPSTALTSLPPMHRRAQPAAVSPLSLHALALLFPQSDSHTCKWLTNLPPSPTKPTTPSQGTIM